MSDEEKSYIINPRDLGEILRTADKDGLTELFERPVGTIVESITGWLAAGPRVWALATGRIIQGALKGKLFQQVASEISELQAKGRIAEDFADRKYGFKTWVELFTVIDEETPDQDRLDALKAMFFAANKVAASDGEQITAYQLFQIAKRLGSNELLTLKAAYALHKDNRPTTSENWTTWTEAMSKHVGHSQMSLLQLAYKALHENLLTNGFTLTDLGRLFCERIECYHIEKESK